MNTYEQIYELVAQIPKGKVMSYGQIAAMMNGRISAQLVGWAMRKAPLTLPCHRVIYNDGSLAGEEVFYGCKNQKALLQEEGVIFSDAFHVNMKSSQV